MSLWRNERNRSSASGTDPTAGKIAESVTLGTKCVAFSAMCSRKMSLRHCLVCLVLVEINIEGTDKLFIIHDSALFAWLIICQIIYLERQITRLRNSIR